ncbi:hypothetical protein BT96DRAFT_1021237 [Gymnopus androsaceus JB14]|uniref:DUF6534 domain-containing protein n=1 Tax=Gymnopus androsaceus JB14 TaxID=1447944 RepID=A0A6A4HG76_9AGAR|nr:hypothetical protein BT96DRAFT_1021237 [Gymnopus androsaceus JB14]
MAQSNLDNTLGALFIGLILSAILNGGICTVTFSQTWFYFSSQTRERSDPLWLKSMVVVIVTLDVLHQLFTSLWMYDYCVTNFGVAAALDVLPWSYYGMAYPTGAVTVIVQSGPYHSPSLVPSFSMLPKSLAFLWLQNCRKDWGQPYAILVNALGASCDILIATAMVYYLRQSRSSIKRTNHMLRSITIFTVTTGIVSSVCAIMVLSMAGAYPGTNIELTFYFMLTRLYANSFLATLNVRDHLRESSYAKGVISASNFVQPRIGPSYEMKDFPSSNFSGQEDTVISVKVDRITNTDYK